MEIELCVIAKRSQCRASNRHVLLSLSAAREEIRSENTSRDYSILECCPYLIASSAIPKHQMHRSFRVSTTCKNRYRNGIETSRFSGSCLRPNRR